NPMVIRYGNSGRAYGLSIVFLLLMFGLIRKVTETATVRWIGLTTIVAVAAVHAVYYNAVLLFALCAAGFFVSARERNWRSGFAVLGIGGIAAISLLPYVPTFL